MGLFLLLAVQPKANVQESALRRKPSGEVGQGISVTLLVVIGVFLAFCVVLALKN